MKLAIDGRATRPRPRSLEVAVTRQHVLDEVRARVGAAVAEHDRVTGVVIGLRGAHTVAVEVWLDHDRFSFEGDARDPDVACELAAAVTCALEPARGPARSPAPAGP